jgi:predicted metal-dependent hydrolase
VRAVQLELPFLVQPEPMPPGAGAAPNVAPAPGPPPVEFVRVARARRYILRVRADGTLRVTVPRWGSRREAEAFVREQQRWVERERIRVREQHTPVTWKDGHEILFRGAMVRIGVEVRGARNAITYGDRTVLANGIDDVRGVVEADLRALARAELEPRLRGLAAVQGLDVRRVTIRNQRSRWGSCARNGSIALNFRLVQMPPDVRDYVLLHELMHLRHPNHSRRFWRQVASVCPGFRDAERWLRVHGRALL